MSLVWLGWDTGNLIPVIALAHTARQNRCWLHASLDTVSKLITVTYTYSDLKLINHVLMRKTNSPPPATVIVSFLQIFSGTMLVITDLGNGDMARCPCF